MNKSKRNNKGKKCNIITKKAYKKKHTYKEKHTYKKKQTNKKKQTYKKKFVSLIGSIPEKTKLNKVYVVTSNNLTGSIVPGLRDYKL